MPIDDLVEQAMRRWPSVPAMYGWLRLDRRGRWLLIDRGRPGFDEARDGHGSEITSPPILDFLGRNYLADDQGRWFWQNGPQRVFADLEMAPLVLRVLGEGTATHLVTHTGFMVDTPTQAWFDPQGNLFLATTMGVGVMHDLDLAQLAYDDAPAGASGDTPGNLADESPRGEANDAPAGRSAQGPTRVQIGATWLELTLLADPPAALGFCRTPRP